MFGSLSTQLAACDIDEELPQTSGPSPHHGTAYELRKTQSQGNNRLECIGKPKVVFDLDQNEDGRGLAGDLGENRDHVPVKERAEFIPVSPVTMDKPQSKLSVVQPSQVTRLPIRAAARNIMALESTIKDQTNSSQLGAPTYAPQLSFARLKLYRR